MLSSITKKGEIVAKMASHTIFQYNVLVIDDTHNTWTNICVKMIIIRFICPRDEEIQNPEEIGRKDQDRGNLLSPVEPALGKLHSSVQWAQRRPRQQHAPDEPTRSRVKASVQWTQKLRLGFCTG